MPRSPSVRDLRGAARLAVTGTTRVTDVVEAVHRVVSRPPALFGAPTTHRTRGIAGFVYRAVRGLARLTGHGLDASLAPLDGTDPAGRSPRRDALVAALNGVVGDHLAATGNSLAIEMQFRQGGRALALDRDALAEAIPDPSGHLLVLVHGICMSDLAWTHRGHDHGAALSREFGYTPLYLFYNSGQHISHNGRAFAAHLEALLAAWPVPVRTLTVVGHSMGGLVARSACHYGEQAGHAWRRRLTALVCLGSPHHGSPLERGGNGIDALLGGTPYSVPFARIGHLRSAGVTDLRHGNVRDEDWSGRDRFDRVGDRRRPLPLPADVACYTVVASNGRRDGSVAERLMGDGLVPVHSALGHHDDPARALAFPPHAQHVVYGRHHFDLLGADAYEPLARWLAGPR